MRSIKKIKALWSLFRAGKVVSDPAKWKKRQITVSAITALIWSVLEAMRAYGYDVVISEDVVNSAAVAVLACVNLVFTVTTTEKVGLPDGGESDS